MKFEITVIPIHTDIATENYFQNAINKASLQRKLASKYKLYQRIKRPYTAKKIREALDNIGVRVDYA
jgi:hypothetical protein